MEGTLASAPGPPGPAVDSRASSRADVGGDASRGTPFPLAVNGAHTLQSDDVSAVVPFGGGRVGVMRSNQAASTAIDGSDRLATAARLGCGAARPAGTVPAPGLGALLRVHRAAVRAEDRGRWV